MTNQNQLIQDLAQLLARRRVLGRLGKAAAAAALSTAGATALAQACRAIPSTTAGPFPGDGTIPGVGRVRNALALSGIVRADITASIGGGAAVAGGVPLTLQLKLVDAQCRPLAGAAVYVWQCDREGRYSMYSSGVEDQDYLRGVQVAGADGTVRFRSIFPGAYPGRWPHVHFETFRNVADIAAASRRAQVSQFALPAEACTAAYGGPGYADAAAALRRMRLERDGIFRGDVAAFTAVTSGGVERGFEASMTLVMPG
ncbi:MAG: intradiol ring-cleavage dioxygenase [Aquabacterium sp.]